MFLLIVRQLGTFGLQGDHFINRDLIKFPNE